MLAKAARENVMFMWLSGGQKPDFRTLNDFRGKLLKGVMEEVFVTAVKMLAAKGYIKLAERVWDEENEEYGDNDLEELKGKDGYTSSDVKELACVLKEKIKQLSDEESKKN